MRSWARPAPAFPPCSPPLATKKGTLIIDRKIGRWTLRPIAHAGQAVSYAARDPRDGGSTWEDASRVVYPEGARYIEQLIPDPKAICSPAGPPARTNGAARRRQKLGRMQARHAE